MHIKRPAHATLVAYAALFMATTGTAYAATGGTFVLGHNNAASATTSLTDVGGTPLYLRTKQGIAPLAVNSTTKVGKLNADLLDGLDILDIQRPLTGSCTNGTVLFGFKQTGEAQCTSAAGGAGTPGPQGPEGPQGPAGPRGLKGDPGTGTSQGLIVRTRQQTINAPAQGQSDTVGTLSLPKGSAWIVTAKVFYTSDDSAEITCTLSPSATGPSSGADTDTTSVAVNGSSNTVASSGTILLMNAYDTTQAAQAIDVRCHTPSGAYSTAQATNVVITAVSVGTLTDQTPQQPPA